MSSAAMSSPKPKGAATASFPESTPHEESDPEDSDSAGSDDDLKIDNHDYDEEDVSISDNILCMDIKRRSRQAITES
jgi:hypothetical protein